MVPRFLILQKKISRDPRTIRKYLNNITPKQRKDKGVRRVVSSLDKRNLKQNFFNCWNPITIEIGEMQYFKRNS